MRKMVDFIKRETVLSVALLLAVVSAFLVKPDAGYISYIDFRTLAILFCLMSVMAGLQKLGIFQWIAEKLMESVHSMVQLVLILTLLCFVFGMFITNDVALITFVPFAITVMHLLGEDCKNRLLVPVTVLQTIAANMGSMLTPIGNPQNLYLYDKAQISVGAFVWLMLPYSVTALAMVVICCVFLGVREKKMAGTNFEHMAAQIARGEKKAVVGDKKRIVLYLLLFAASLLTVAGFLPYGISLALTVVSILIWDRQVLKKVDYSLLLTFVAFFIFVGNMGRIPQFSALLERVVVGNEVPTVIVVSQAISNVPAALLLSGFTDNFKALIVGTNLGGLGTLIASMASLITYKFIVREAADRKGVYLLKFTLLSVCFLSVLVILYLCIGVH